MVIINQFTSKVQQRMHTELVVAGIHVCKPQRKTTLTVFVLYCLTEEQPLQFLCCTSFT